MAHKKVVLTPRKCVICGKEFQPKMRTQLTCSQECAYEEQKKKSRNRNREIREMKKNSDSMGICIQCGKPFMKTGNTKTCSLECQKRRNNEMRRKRSVRKKDESYMLAEGYGTNGRFIESERKRKSAHKPTHSLAETIKAAKERGMSYGEYVARYGL